MPELLKRRTNDGGTDKVKQAERTRIAASYLNRAKALSEMPDAAKPFFDVLENTFVKLQGIPLCAESSAKIRKTIGTLCVMVPTELIYAAG